MSTKWILSTFMLLFAAVTAAGAQEVGQIKVAERAAFIQRAGQNIPAAVGMKVNKSDTLMTGAGGKIGVTFLDSSLISIGPNSVFVIEQYAFDSTTHAGQFDGSLKKGTLAGVSGKMVKQAPESMRIRTPASIMGVRGTEFVISVEDPEKK